MGLSCIKSNNEAFANIQTLASPTTYIQLQCQHYEEMKGIVRWIVVHIIEK